MSHRTQRAVALVPLTALLCSGVLAATPALADDAVAPQSLVDGFDSDYTQGEVVVNPGPVTIDFVPSRVSARTSFDAGHYWLRIEHLAAGATETDVRYVDVPFAGGEEYRWVLDTTGGGAGDAWQLDFLLTGRPLSNYHGDLAAIERAFMALLEYRIEDGNMASPSTVVLASAGDPAFELSWVGVQQDDLTPVPAAFEAIPTITRPRDVFVGDWDGDGVDTPAYRDHGTNLFHMAPSLDAVDLATWTPMAYGRPGQAVYIGDWDGDGKDTFGVRQPGTNLFQARNDFDGGPAQIETSYGRSTDEIIVGRFRAGGPDVLSVRRGNSFYLKYDYSGGEADLRTDFGRPDDVVVIGDWDGNGVDSPGVRRGSTYFLNNTFDGGTVPGIEVGSWEDKHLVAGLTADGPDQILALWVDALNIGPVEGE